MSMERFVIFGCVQSALGHLGIYETRQDLAKTLQRDGDHVDQKGSLGEEINLKLKADDKFGINLELYSGLNMMHYINILFAN